MATKTVPKKRQNHIVPTFRGLMTPESAQEDLKEAGVTDVEVKGFLHRVQFFHNGVCFVQTATPQNGKDSRYRHYVNVPIERALVSPQGILDYCHSVGLPITGSMGLVLQALAEYHEADHTAARESGELVSARESGKSAVESARAKLAARVGQAAVKGMDDATAIRLAAELK